MNHGANKHPLRLDVNCFLWLAITGDQFFPQTLFCISITKEKMYTFYIVIKIPMVCLQIWKQIRLGQRREEIKSRRSDN